jgi:tetratricopeptide (TPR) repeat protein
MRKMLLMVLVAFVFCPLVFSQQAADPLKEIDKLHDDSKHAEARQALFTMVPKLVSNKDKCEVYWRLARETLDLGDEAEDQKMKQEEILKIFEEGERYADQAIKFDKNNAVGYFWKTANMGRWGQVKGILDSLGKAEPMRVELKKAITIDPEYPDAFYTLGILYELLPGWPLSFGNAEFSVSLARKSIDLMEKQLKDGKIDKPKYVYYVELANHLSKRNWNASTRDGKQKEFKKNYDSNNDVLDKNCYYEGSVTLKSVSDKDEAKALVAMVISEFEKMPSLSKSDAKDLKKAKESKNNNGL